MELVLPPGHAGDEFPQSGVRRPPEEEALQQQHVQHIGGGQQLLPLLLQLRQAALHGGAVHQAQPVVHVLIEPVDERPRPGQKVRVRLVPDAQPLQQGQEDVLPRLDLALLDLAQVTDCADAAAQPLLAPVLTYALAADQRARKQGHRISSFPLLWGQYSGGAAAVSRTVSRRRDAGSAGARLRRPAQKKLYASNEMCYTTGEII